MSVNLGTAHGRIVIDSSGAVRGFDAAGVAAGKFTKGLVGLGVGAAVGKALFSTVDATADFNQAMADMAATAEVSGATLERLSDQALDAGRRTRFSATEAAAGQLELAKAGLTAEQILDGGLDTALALAAAGNLGVAESATIAANAVQLFGLEGRDLTGVADALATAANRTTADVGDMGLALSQGGAAAKQAGLDFKGSVTFLEALALQGVRGSDAGTSLKAALLALAAPVGEGAKAIKRYGLEFFDANGEVKDAAEISDELRSKLGGLNRQQRTAVLQAIAGRDGFRALAAAYDLGPVRLRALTRELGREGAAAEVAGRRQDSLRGDVEQLGGAIETLQIQAGARAVPALRALAQEATQVVNAVSSGEGAVGEFAAGLADLGVGAVRVFGGVASAAWDTAEAVGSAVAPVVAFTGGVVASETGVRLLTAAVIGLSAAYVAGKAAAVGLMAVQRAEAVFQSARAFVQLAVSVRSAAEAQALFSAATLASPMGVFAVGVGVAAGAVALLSGSFSSGPSAADQYRDALDAVNRSAADMRTALNLAKQAVEDITASKLNAASAALGVERSEQNYQRAVVQSGKDSLEAREAENQLAQARQRLASATGDANTAGAKAAETLVDEIGKQAELNAELKRSAGEQANLAATSRIGAGSSKEAAAQSEKYASAAAQAAEASKQGDEALAVLQRRAREAARALASETTPAAQKARAELLAIANAKPADLPKVLAAIKSGGAKATIEAERVSAKVQTALKQVDTPVSLSSFVGSIIAGGGPAIAAAKAIASQVRAALRSANADHRNSPSANDLLQASLTRQAAITTNGLRRTQTVTRQGVDDILGEHVRLEARLRALDQQEEARNRGKETRAQRTVRIQRESLQHRVDLLSSVGSSLSNLESGVADIAARIGQALDLALQKALDAAQANFDQTIKDIAGSAEAARVGEIDQTLAAADTARRERGEAKRRAELGKASADAAGKVARLQGVLANARTDSERAAARSLLNQAVTEAAAAAADVQAFEEDVNIGRLQRERDALQAVLQARRDAAQVALDEARAAAERETAQRKAAAEKALGDLVEQLRNREITVRQFGDRVGEILGDPDIAKALQESGETLGLSFIRGLDRTRAGVAAAARRLAANVAAYLKLNSPADKGPLRHDFTRSGAVLGEDFAAGMASSRRLVEREASLLAAKAVTAPAAATGGGSGGGGTVTQNITVNADNPLEDPFLLARRLSYEARFGLAAAAGAG